MQTVQCDNNNNYYYVNAESYAGSGKGIYYLDQWKPE